MGVRRGEGRRAAAPAPAGARPTPSILAHLDIVFPGTDVDVNATGRSCARRASATTPEGWR